MPCLARVSIWCVLTAGTEVARERVLGGGGGGGGGVGFGAVAAEGETEGAGELGLKAFHQRL